MTPNNRTNIATMTSLTFFVTGSDPSPPPSPLSVKLSAKKDVNVIPTPQKGKQIGIQNLDVDGTQTQFST